MPPIRWAGQSDSTRRRAKQRQRDPSRSAWTDIPLMFSRLPALGVFHRFLFLSIRYCDADRHSLCHHDRITRGNYTNYTSTSFLPHFLSTSILYKMSVPEKQEAVSSTVGDDPAKIEDEEDTTVYPKGIQFVMLMASFYLGVFMVSLVRRIHHFGQSMERMTY
jgi:hypothetical protein